MLVGFELTTSGLGQDSYALPTELGESVGLEITEVSFVSFMHHFTFWTFEKNQQSMTL